VGSKSSVWDQPVAPLFSTPRAERQRRALPVLRRMRMLVLSGKHVKLYAALFAAAGAELLVREFARHELVRAMLPGWDVAVIDAFGDANLVLWLVDRALAACGFVHKGGFRVSSGPRRQTARAA
jgi:hypothetical protein